MRPVKLIVIHCSATKESVDYTPEQLEQDHQARGFQCAGYHYYVRRSGAIVAMRPLGMIGAHVKGHNRFSVGVCYEGGLNAIGQAVDTRSTEQKAALWFLLEQLRERFPTARICGHRDLSPDRNGDGVISSDEWLKECPSFDAASEYALI